MTTAQEPHGPEAGGRPGTVVAIDVGGTALKGAVVTVDGTAVAGERLPMAAPDDAERVAGQVEDLVRALSAAAAERTGGRPQAVGLVMPGAFDEDTGTATYAANIGWAGLDLRSRVRSVLDVPVAFGHDATAGGIAEAHFGAARGERHFLFVALGTGIGAAVVLGGAPYRGAHGLGGEIGHIQVRPDGARCGCGARGCLETLASAAAVRRRFAGAGGDPDLQPSEVLRRGAAGTDAVAVTVWREAVDALATVLTGVQRLLDLDLVVVGGGLAAAGDALLEPLGTELARRAAFQRPPRLQVGTLGTEAGSFGAAVLAWRAVAAPAVGAPPADEPARAD